MDKLFFSFVIPAHNEETGIVNTLRHLQELDYPADRYEVIVIENGSTDGTLALANMFENDRLRVLVSGKGVSRAKNAGINHLAKESNWVIFLDADTVVERNFLNELQAFLVRRSGLSVGTVSLMPLPDTRYARAWFWVHNVGHRLSKTPYAIKLVRRDLFPVLRFDEDLVIGEDIAMIRKAQTHGKFFFMWTRSISTSTRRFEKFGWWYVLFYWVFVALLPTSWQRKFRYDEVR